jgi:hypothetical protein
MKQTLVEQYEREKTLMPIDLNPEQERIVDDAIRAGLIREPHDVIEAGIGVLRERLQSRPHDMTGVDEWTRELHAWIYSHSSAAPVLTDQAVERDSIYGTRGF